MFDFDQQSDEMDSKEISCFWQSCAVIINRETEQIRFTKCHVPRRFLAITDREFSCSFEDIRAVHFTPSTSQHPGGLTIVTTTGKAFISATASNFRELRDWIGEAVSENDPAYATDNPAVFYVCMCGTILGILAGTYLARDAGETQFAISVIAGAILGAVSGYLFVNFGAHILQTDFAQPIMYVVIGALFGLVTSQMLRLIIGWNQPIMWTLILGGGILGTLLTKRRHSVKRE